MAGGSAPPTAYKEVGSVPIPGNCALVSAIPDVAPGKVPRDIHVSVAGSIGARGSTLIVAVTLTPAAVSIPNPTCPAAAESGTVNAMANGDHNESATGLSIVPPPMRVNSTRPAVSPKPKPSMMNSSPRVSTGSMAPAM